jgi:hypothetical protein
MSDTRHIYSLIHDGRFRQASKALIPFCVSRSFPARSLLAYCYYQTSEFRKAADIYSSLGYILQEAQCWFKAGEFVKAQDVLQKIEYVTEEVVTLQKMIAFEI